MSKILVLLTTLFPYGKGEDFVANELSYFNGFDKKIIVPTEGITDEKRKTLLNDFTVKAPPKNIAILEKACGYATQLFSKSVQSELRQLQMEKKYCFSTCKYACAFLWKSKQIKKHVEYILKQERVEENDTIVFYAYWMMEAAYAGILVKSLYPNSKVVARCHGYDLYAERQAHAYLPFRKSLCQQLDCIFPISMDGQQYLQTHYKAWLNAHVILSRLGCEPAKQLISKDENGIFTIVSCSNVIPIKRVDLILNALVMITDRKIRWIHFGDGYLLDQIKQKAQEQLPVNIEVSFRGFVPNEELRELYGKMQIDVFVNVSENEGVPVSIMEAMSFGIPVIATDVGGTSEIVEHGINGCLLPKDFRTTELLNCILKIYDSPDYAKNLQKAAYHTWDSKYNAEKNYRRFVQDLNELADGDFKT